MDRPNSRMRTLFTSDLGPGRAQIAQPWLRCDTKQEDTNAALLRELVSASLFSLSPWITCASVHPIADTVANTGLSSSTLLYELMLTQRQGFSWARVVYPAEVFFMSRYQAFRSR